MFEEKVCSSIREELINITPLVRKNLDKSGLESGLCIVYIPHTTAGVCINENADPDVPRDLIMGLKHVVPSSLPFAHIEGNSDAHLKSCLVGSSVMIPIENSSLQLGTWQGVFFCEFDGPRSRRVYIQFIKS
jgi:secondary thiamine-phosphate synthase enzyme